MPRRSASTRIASCIRLFGRSFILLTLLTLALAAKPALAAPQIWLPIPPGETWRVIQGYGCGTHDDWDRYSLDLVNTLGPTRGAPVRAAADGTIWNWVAGSGTLLIKHSDSFYTMYTHMDRAVTTTRDTFVTRGTVIGAVGDRGAPGTPHLHFTAFTGEGIGRAPESPLASARLRRWRRSVRSGRMQPVRRRYTQQPVGGQNRGEYRGKYSCRWSSRRHRMRHSHNARHTSTNAGRRWCVMRRHKLRSKCGYVKTLFDASSIACSSVSAAPAAQAASKVSASSWARVAATNVRVRSATLERIVLIQWLSGSVCYHSQQTLTRLRSLD